MTTNRGRRYMQLREKVDPERDYELDDALELIKSTSTANFDETVESAFNIGVNPSQNMIRGTVVLPHGTGKEIKVVAFARGEKQREAEQAGADFVGGEELAEKIEDGWLEFDEVVSTPDMMSVVGRLGRILGPRGMMPSPKSNTVTEDIADAIEKLKKGQVEFRTDKYGVMHVPIGKASFTAGDLKENLVSVFDAINDLRPDEGVKGRYFRKLTLSSTMGPGVRVELNELRRMVHKRRPS